MQPTSTSYSLTSVGLTDGLSSIFETAINLNFPIAVWRLPLQDEIRLIVDLSGQSKRVKVDLENLGEGFVIHPFHSSEEKSAQLLNADLLYSSKEKQLKVNPLFQDSHTTELFFQGLAFNGQNGQGPKYYTSQSRVTQRDTDYEDYLEMVRKGIDVIQQGSLKKIVLSRQKMVNLNPDFNPIKIFIALSEAYPGAFVNLVSLPGQGTWMGATPEVLVSQVGDVFKTVSLAGTQKAEADSNPLQIGWTQKEIEEQALVGRYIINCFKKIRLREFEEEGPKTIRAANLFHLKSEYTVNTKEVNFPQLATVMLDLLHPTSAVCGMPKEESMQFILDNEGYDRTNYAGYLGPVNLDNQSHLFVNLRCMQLFEHSAILYAGGGITEYSDPEKEWQETEMKCNTLLNIIRRS